MSELLRLEKLTLNNFKLFGEEYTVNFNSNDLIVFDGPNGHGKTTIYDATELALTGEIRRLSSTENQQNPSDVVVAHKNNKDCFVRLELKNSQKSIVIERRLKANISNSDKKISNFKKLWDLYLIVNNKKTPLSQLSLNKLIGNPNLARDFTLFHYVEQEDTAHFLKHKKEKERAEALSVLFGDTIEMQKKVSKVEAVEQRIVQLIKEKNLEKVTLEQRGNLALSIEERESKITYKPLLEWHNSGLEWDKEKIEGMSSEKRDSYLLELHRIESLVLYRNHFLLHRKHLLASQQDDILKLFLSHSKYISRFDSIKEEFRQVNLIKQIHPLLNSDKFEQLFLYPHLTESFSIVNYEQGDSFFKTLSTIVKGTKDNQNSSKFLLDLLSYRNHIKEHLKNDTSEKDCFLCGTNFKSSQTLIESIDNKEVNLKSILSNDAQRLDEIKNKFINEMLPLFSTKIEEFILNSSAPSREHLTSLERVSSSVERFNKLDTWLNDSNISFQDLLLEYQPNGHQYHDVEQKVSELKSRILAKVKHSPDGYDELNDEVNFENAFKIYFKANSNYLRSLDKENLMLKAGYINQLYVDSISNDIKSYQDVKDKISALSSKKDRIYDMRKSLKSAISRYQKLLIKDIEIPFYIYSGKILQAHQSGIGNGIFIKDKTGGEELKNIRFVSNWNSDHDVINTMSSGQIAAVVITLYLALNKVYAKGLSSLLIDDPVQTMDEINMISLVELLRNEFSDRQIILSTHEDHVSRYFMYKFLKYKRNVRQMKLLERKEYQLSN
jgi:exonuclease SbcC